MKYDLLSNNVELEEHGGDVQVVEISALTGMGLDELEECILTQAELMDIRGDPEGPAEGVVIESHLDQRKG